MSQQVDLTNCDREPIHIPGSVQPHGVLLAFDSEATLVAHSANARELLGDVPELGERLESGSTSNPIWQSVQALLDDPAQFDEHNEFNFNGDVFDASCHQAQDWKIVEFEPRVLDGPRLHTFAYQAQNALAKIQSSKSLDDLLQVATREVHRITGFDRVLCYRFRYDDSGDVVAEEKRSDLESFLGLRFPTSDIPAQARALYILNTLRFITDVNAVPCPLIPPLGPDAARPLDLSHSKLRSVSPIHVEYLQNMGVTASLSISIVVEGRLWGLFACHHYSGPKLVPQPVRVAGNLLSQVVSVLIERIESRKKLEFVESSRTKRDQLLESAEDGESLLSVLFDTDELADLIPCDGIGATEDGRIVVRGAAPSSEFIKSLLGRFKEHRSDDVVYTNTVAKDYPGFEGRQGVAGFLAIRYDRDRDGWVFWFRKEQSQTVRWAGRPDKVYRDGPLGSRLSPRGSFEEYLDQVKEIALPWHAAEIEVASRLRAGLQDIAFAHMSKFSRAREILVATLGHDLRSPLHAIDMSAYLLSEESETSRELSSKISSYSNRMKRMIDHMLDFSRLQAGLRLCDEPVPSDAESIVKQVIDEMHSGFPGFEVVLESNVCGPAQLDPERFAQLVSNLLSNANHHGDASAPTRVNLKGGGSSPLRMEVANKGAAISAEKQKTLFDPLKGSFQDSRNPRGLGLGLYIVHQIAQELGGFVEVGPYSDGFVNFIVEIPPGP